MAAAAAREDMDMVMENAGFADDDTKVTVVEVETSLADNSQHNGDIQVQHQQQQHCEAAAAAVPAVPAEVNGAAHCDAALCEEAKAKCSCVVKQPTQKVELQSWVHPKGWVLLGTVLCLTAWIIVYFTVTHFYEA